MNRKVFTQGQEVILFGDVLRYPPGEKPYVYVEDGSRGVIQKVIGVGKAEMYSVNFDSASGLHLPGYRLNGVNNDSE
jgi:hypothetical protein